MESTARIEIEAKDVRSLVWSNDSLVDWVGGGMKYSLAGKCQQRLVSYSYRFDAVCAEGDIAVIYERTGTKGLVLERGKVVREINRSFYYANAYEYPICLWTGKDGRVLLAHCPEAYNKIEIEDALTGARLTAPENRKPSDIFHSGLQVSPGGNLLLSAGWVWHPLGRVEVFNIDEALANSGSLDATFHRGLLKRFQRHAGMVDADSACWIDPEHLLVAGPPDDGFENDFDEDIPEELQLRPQRLLTVHVPSDTVVAAVDLDIPAGRMMPVGRDRILTLYGHPRLRELDSGRVLEEWPDIRTGEISSCIVWNAPIPILALDPGHRRIAIALDECIHVLRFS